MQIQIRAAVFVVFATMCPILVAAAASQTAQPPLVPAGMSLSALIQGLALRTHSLIGAELLPGGMSPAGPGAGPGTSPTLPYWFFLAAPEALEVFATRDGRYEYTEQDRVHNLTPRGSALGVASFLDVQLDVFSVTDATAFDIITAIHREFDPTHTARHTAAELGAGRASEQESDRLKQRLSRKFTFRLTRVTARQVLNEAIRQGGDLFWCVSYRRAPAVYENAAVMISGFDGWSVGQGATSHPATR